ALVIVDDDIAVTVATYAEAISKFGSHVAAHRRVYDVQGYPAIVRKNRVISVRGQDKVVHCIVDFNVQRGSFPPRRLTDIPWLVGKKSYAGRISQEKLRLAQGLF